jgi:hypothetical protein
VDGVDGVDLMEGVERRREFKFEDEDGNWLLAIGYARSAWVAGEKSWREVL